jgi:hypothetical protein
MVESKLSLKQAQLEFARHIRNPTQNQAPAGIEDRRMGIYRELFYNNIEGFISSAFPVLRSISEDEYWHELVRDFISVHRAKTPYFMEIAQEFLSYLSAERAAAEHSKDPVFMLELAHYEWVELALDVAEGEVPEASVDFSAAALLDYVVTVSPLVMCLTYAYPVHRIGPEFLCQYSPLSAPAQATHLIVYRNSKYEVGFMEANAVTLRLLQSLQQQAGKSLYVHLDAIAKDLQLPICEAFLNGATEQLLQLQRLDIVR